VASTTTEANGTTPTSRQTCADPDCDCPRWTIVKRKRPLVVSEFCEEHSNVPIFDVPVAPVPKPARRRNPALAFRKEVEEQRLEREDSAPRDVDPDKAHPATYSDQLLPHLGEAVAAWGLPVHDPFAGTGTKLGRLCDELGLDFTGTEIEPELIADPRVRHGDSIDAETYPAREYVICTSPTYGNGMNDHFKAKDDSKRMNYRWALAQINGYDRELHVNNSGRYGVAERRSAGSERHYWRVNRACVAHWPDRCLVNVKDVGPYGGELVPLVGRWIVLLEGFGYEIVKRVDVECPGNKNSPNRERAETEAVLVCERQP
jgi:hypothetical protein